MLSGNFLPKNSSANKIVFLSKNSMAVGLTLALIISGTASNPWFWVSNGTNKDKLSVGFGIIFKIALVIIASVPSDPIIKCFNVCTFNFI